MAKFKKKKEDKVRLLPLLSLSLRWHKKGSRRLYAKAQWGRWSVTILVTKNEKKND